MNNNNFQTRHQFIEISMLNDSILEVKITAKIKAFEILRYGTIAIAGGLFADNYKDYIQLFTDAGIEVFFTPSQLPRGGALVLTPGWQKNNDSISDAIRATKNSIPIFEFDNIKGVLEATAFYRHRLLYGI